MRTWPGAITSASLADPPRSSYVPVSGPFPASMGKLCLAGRFEARLVGDGEPAVIVARGGGLQRSTCAYG